MAPKQQPYASNVRDTSPRRTTNANQASASPSNNPAGPGRPSIVYPQAPVTNAAEARSRIAETRQGQQRILQFLRHGETASVAQPIADARRQTAQLQSEAVALSEQRQRTQDLLDDQDARLVRIGSKVDQAEFMMNALLSRGVMPAGGRGGAPGPSRGRSTRGSGRGRGAGRGGFN